MRDQKVLGWAYCLAINYNAKGMKNITQNVKKIRKGDVLKLKVTAMASQGQGVAKHKIEDGLFTVFLDGVAEGDQVNAEIFKIKNRWALGKVVEIVKPSKKRIEPRCKHFSECGGCTFQHLEHEEQMKIKKQFTIDAFERLGNFQKPPVQDVLFAGEEWFYRNKMELSFGEDKDRNLALGFHVPNRRFDIFNLEECFLESEFLPTLVEFMRNFAIDHKLKPVNSFGEGKLLTLTIREGKNTDERLVYLTTTKGPFRWMKKLGLQLQEFFPAEINSFYWMEKIVERGTPTKIIPHHIFGEQNLKEKLEINDMTFDFIIEPQAFFQPNTRGAELLYAEVLKQVGDVSKKTVFDLFCGTGTIGITIAPSAKKVIGVEINTDAVKSARQNALINHLENMEFVCGDVVKVLSSVKEKPDVIVLDPPRAGLLPASIDDICVFKPKRIVYVSCNPSTLARDCALLCEKGYKLLQIQPVDMFPQTYHVENVVLLEL